MAECTPACICLYLPCAQRSHVTGEMIAGMQADITLEMRSVLVDWLAEVRDDFHLSSETLFLGTRYVDRCAVGSCHRLSRESTC